MTSFIEKGKGFFAILLLSGPLCVQFLSTVLGTVQSLSYDYYRTYYTLHTSSIKNELNFEISTLDKVQFH